ncbi:MAG TPA: SMP-30/gluconolactonase/LRE family protein [Pedomonas sp.]|uniref:SMP-30/gluconolactonase/LRE family protein n=1 Tax=Pedomonas sp. TaxID=2976421 RepID=UPI002F3F3A99
MIVLPQPEVVIKGLTLPECPRWHDGALYFSDIAAGRVYRLKSDDDTELLYESPDDFIGGLGFLDNGDLIAVSSKQRKLLRIGRNGTEVHADLSALCNFVLNDMVVVADHAFVSQPGFDIWSEPAPGMPSPTDVIHAPVAGAATVAASEMMSPNGMAVSPDGRTLYVAECTAMRITCFTINPETGALSDRRVFGALPDGGIPDGICLDHTGAVWAAVPVAVDGTSFGAGPGVVRMAEGDKVTHVVPVGKGRRALACAFGGTDRTTLYICTVPDFDGAAAHTAGQGRVERVSLNFKGAGIP